MVVGLVLVRIPVELVEWEAHEPGVVPAVLGQPAVTIRVAAAPVGTVVTVVPA